MAHASVRITIAVAAMGMGVATSLQCGRRDPCDGGPYCDGDVAVSGCCTRACVGLEPRVWSKACPRFCVAAEEAAFCAESDEPDPRCPAHGDVSSSCDGSYRLHCYHGYIYSPPRDCSPGLCVDDDPLAGCTRDSVPDPACIGAVDDRACSGSELLVCSGGGYVTGVADCGTDVACTETLTGQNFQCTWVWPPPLR